MGSSKRARALGPPFHRGSHQSVLFPPSIIKPHPRPHYQPQPHMGVHKQLRCLGLHAPFDELISHESDSRVLSKEERPVQAG